MKRRIAFIVAVVAVAVCADFLGSLCARQFSVPLYLYSVLTIAATALGGLWAGIAVAVLSNATLQLIDSYMLPFTFCHISTAVLAWLTFRHHQKRAAAQAHTARPAPLELDTFIWAGFWSAISNAILGNVTVDVLFSSNTVEHINNTVQAIYIAVPNLTFATYFSGLLMNLADKTISALVSFAAYLLADRHTGNL